MCCGCTAHDGAGLDRKYIGNTELQKFNSACRRTFFRASSSNPAYLERANDLLISD